ncbi:hypothetical protein [Qipengyuania sp. RANM35]|uniref:hypothetical protein n=1 Tax=Qipengyuania sp. RANM35 TaxID=3068635 RepID=UPI0034DB1C9F
MSFSDPRDDSDHTLLSLGLVLVMLGAFGYLVLGSRSGSIDEFTGFGALIALPVCVGALLTLNLGSYSPLGCLVAPVGLGILCYILVQLGAEGLICVVMVMPVWFLAGLGGGLVALFALRRKEDDDAGSSRLRSVGLAVLPFLLIYAEEVAPADWEQREVVRSVVIEAEAEKIWPLLVSIPRIGPEEGKGTFTHDWLGVPRPTEARLVERNGERVRLAQWGADARFEEAITSIRPGRSIDWDFTFPDPSLQNKVDRHVSPDGEILKIRSGSYRLEPMPDGRTRVTLATRYAMCSRLDWYFGWWGERMLGDVQNNVLAIIRQRSAA